MSFSRRLREGSESLAIRNLRRITAESGIRAAVGKIETRVKELELVDWPLLHESWRRDLDLAAQIAHKRGVLV